MMGQKPNLKKRPYRLLYKTIKNKEKRRKQQGNYFSGCFSLHKLCNQGNHQLVVKTTNLFIV